jgi:hypothetical protein
MFERIRSKNHSQNRNSNYCRNSMGEKRDSPNTSHLKQISDIDSS